MGSELPAHVVPVHADDRPTPAVEGGETGPRLIVFLADAPKKLDRLDADQAGTEIKGRIIEQSPFEVTLKLVGGTAANERVLASLARRADGVEPAERTRLSVEFVPGRNKWIQTICAVRRLAVVGVDAESDVEAELVGPHGKPRTKPLRVLSATALEPASSSATKDDLSQFGSDLSIEHIDDRTASDDVLQLGNPKDEGLDTPKVVANIHAHIALRFGKAHQLQADGLPPVEHCQYGSVYFVTTDRADASTSTHANSTEPVGSRPSVDRRSLVGVVRR
jgi:hypothetical protein